MGGFFSLDSKFMQAMSRVADLIILNVIYLVTCLPVITIGAAGTAMYTVCFRLGTDREGSLVKGYFRAFRDEEAIQAATLRCCSARPPVSISFCFSAWMGGCTICFSCLCCSLRWW